MTNKQEAEELIERLRGRYGHPFAVMKNGVLGETQFDLSNHPLICEAIGSLQALAALASQWQATNEVAAWRARFPTYTFRPQDDCIALRHSAQEQEAPDLVKCKTREAELCGTPAECVELGCASVAASVDEALRLARSMIGARPWDVDEAIVNLKDHLTAHITQPHKWAKALDCKWLDAECAEKGCQSLVLRPAQPPREPLSDEQIEAGRKQPWGMVTTAFDAGVKFAEAAHSITTAPKDGT